jgi:hypothetical protein
LVLDLINELKSIYTSCIKPKADNNVDSKFLSYIQRACLFMSLQSLLQNMKKNSPSVKSLNLARNCLVHNIPQADKVFIEAASSGTNIFIEFANLVAPLRHGSVPAEHKQGLHKRCNDVFAQENIEKFTIKKLMMDSKNSSPEKILEAEDDIDNHITEFTKQMSLFESEGRTEDAQNKNKLAIVVSAFFAAELDARISDEIDPTQKAQLKRKINDWFGNVLTKGRIARHESTDVLLDSILSTERPSKAKIQDSKPFEGDESTQSESTQSESTKSTSDSNSSSSSSSFR